MMTFLGPLPSGSMLRTGKRDWGEQRTRTAVSLGKSAGLRTTFVTEDTIRSTPDLLEALFTAAIEEGADGLCLCDTVSHATTQGTRSLIEFTRALISKLGSDADVDWHGHNDRGLSLANTLEAIRAGPHASTVRSSGWESE